MPHKDPAERSAYLARWRDAHPTYAADRRRKKAPRIRRQKRAAYKRKLARDPAAARRSQRAATMAKYGLTLSAYEALRESQRGLCRLCETRLRGGRAEHVDHCHETGRVRGILCNQCNTALGKLGDNEAGLLRALAYVRGDL